MIVGATAIVFVSSSMEEEVDPEAARVENASEDETGKKPQAVTVPVKDPEALKLMEWNWGEAVSAEKCNKFFRIWGYLEEAGLTKTDSEGNMGSKLSWVCFYQVTTILLFNSSATTMSVFTVSDVTFGQMIPMDIGDPFVMDPWLQRLVLNTQLVDHKVDPENPPAEVKTIGGRTLKITRANDTGKNRNHMK